MVPTIPNQLTGLGESKNLGKVFSDHVGTGRVAVIDFPPSGTPRQTTYDALDASCDAVARGLVASGLRLGDRIGILSYNRTECLEVLFGAMRAGLIPVPLNNKLTREGIAYIVNDADIRLVFGDEQHRGLNEGGPRYLDFDNRGSGGYKAFRDPGPYQAVSPPPSHVAIQPYTSGSTGRPKGVLLSNSGQLWFALTNAADRSMTQHDVVLVAAPLCHKNALGNMKTVLAAGSRAVLLPRFEAASVIRCIEEYRIARITGVPPMLALLLAQEELIARSDLSSITHVGMGSAPASDELFERLQQVFPNAGLSFNYGTTEGGLTPFGNAHPNRRIRPLKSIGTPLPGCEVRLEDGPDPDSGVLYLRNPAVMLGYHNLPDETEARLSNGWFDTGDIVRRDAEGWYFFVERSDDMFVCGGENLYPREIESLLERHPSIQQAVVVPVSDPVKGFVPCAFVVLHTPDRLSEHEIKAYTLAEGPAYAHPRRVFELDVLPLSGSNKVDRQALLRWARSKVGETLR